MVVQLFVFLFYNMLRTDWHNFPSMIKPVTAEDTQWRRNEFESGGTGPEQKWGVTDVV